MRRSRGPRALSSLLLLGLAALVCFLGWRAISSGPRAGGEPATAALPGSARVEASPPSGSPDETGDAEPGSPGTPPSPPAVTGEGALPDERLPAEPADEEADDIPRTPVARPRPLGALVGRVVDAQGAPLRQALVLAAPAGVRLAWTVPGAADPPDPAQYSWPYVPEVESFSTTDGLPPWPLDSPLLPVVPHSTLTGDDGEFHLARIPVGWVALSVRAAGYVSLDLAEHHLVSTEVLDVGPLRLERGARLAGRVLDGEGRPVAGARWWRPGDGASPHLRPECGEMLAETDLDGHFELDRLPPGPLRLALTAADHPTRHLDLDAEPGERLRDRDVVLRNRSVLSGTVVLTGGGSFLGLRVAALPERRILDLLAGTPAHLLEGYREAPVESEVLELLGFFALGSVRQGERYLVRAIPAGSRFARADEWSRPVLARAGELAVAPPYGADAGFDVRIGFEGGARRFVVNTGVGPLLTRDLAPGPQRFTGLRPGRPGDDRAADLILTVAGLETVSLWGLVIEPGVTTDLGRLHLARAPVVAVRVLDAESDRPVRGALVQLELPHGQRSFTTYPTASTGVDGGAQLPNHPLLGRSPVFVRAQHSDYAPAVVDAPPAGGAPAELRLTQGSIVELQVTDPYGSPVANVPVRRVREVGPSVPLDDGSPAEVWTDARGIARFPRQVPGRHRFRVEPPAGFQGDEIDVFAGEAGSVTKRLPVGALSTFFGDVRGERDPLPGARVWLLDPVTFERHAEDVAARAFERLPPWLPTARTDATGRWRLRPVWESDEEYALVVDHPSLALPFVRYLEPRAGEQDVAIRLRTRRLLARVSESEFDPLDSLDVRVRYRRVSGRTPERDELVERLSDAARDTDDEEYWFGESELGGLLAFSGPTVHAAWNAPTPGPVQESKGDWVRFDDVPLGLELELVAVAGGAVLGFSAPFEFGGRDRKKSDLPEVVVHAPATASLRLGERSRWRDPVLYPGFLAVHASRFADPPAMRWIPRDAGLAGVEGLAPGRWVLFTGRPDALGRVSFWEVAEALDLQPGEAAEF